MKVLQNKIKEIEAFLNNYLAFYFANGNKQNRIKNYNEEN
jgi:hypothetical protein